jgi:hypothetical protein
MDSVVMADGTLKMIELGTVFWPPSGASCRHPVQPGEST